jgi:hypothetical protein
MTNPTDRDSPVRRNAIALGKLVAAAAGLAVLTHVSWNMFAPDLFGLPELRIKQALGLVGFGFVLAVLLRQARPRHG